MVNVARPVDLIVIGLYLAATLAIGARFLRRSSTAKGFTIGSRAIPTWAVGLSVLGTFVSSISFVGNAGKAYSDDWAPFLFALTVPPLAVLAGRIFVPLYRGQGEVSAYSHLEKRLGYWARAYGSISFQLLQLGRVSVILYLVAIVVAPMLNLPVPTIIIGLGVLVTVYTMLGGIEAVIWTDVMQVIVMFGGALWCLVLIIAAIPGGPGQVLTIAADAGGKFDLGEMSLSWGSQTFLGVLLYGIMANLQNFGIDQNYVQRYHTAKSDGEARRALLIASLPFIPVTALFLAIGTSLFAYYRVFPNRLPEGTLGDMAFPHFIATQLPEGLSGLLVAAILAAAMSTISSNLNCMATVFTEDIFRPFWKPVMTERFHVLLLRGLTIFAGCAGTGFGVLMIGNRSGLDVFWQISATVGSGLLGIFLLSLLPQRLEPAAVKVATLAAIVFVLWANFSAQLTTLPESMRADINPLLAGTLGTLFLIALAVALSYAGFGRFADRRAISATRQQ